MKSIPPFSEAAWISSDVIGSRRTVPPAPYFRSSFFISKEVQSARLLITALGLYECTINGCSLTDAVFTPGWTDYTKRCSYQSLTITDALKRGENVIGVILADGWYSGHLGWGERQAYGDRPQFLAEVEVTYRNGSVERFGTGESWKTTVGAILENDIQMGETYDARLEPLGWERSEYDDSAWTAAKLAPVPDILVEPAPGPSVRRMGILPSINVTDLIERIFPSKLYDFGQNFCGRVRIRIQAPAGTTLTLCFGEMTNSDGTLYTENLRGARCTDRYTCRGDGIEEWEPKFTFHGFRYAEVTGLKPEHFFEIEGVVLHADMKVTGHFACSNPLLNQLQHNIVWSQKGNFLEVPMDCPQRDERLGWTGDAQIFMATAAFNMDVSGFFRKWMTDLRDAQAPTGWVFCVAPRLGRSDIIPERDGGPAYSDAIVICPWQLYLSYGDTSALAENYEAMGRYMDYIEAERSVEYIRGHASVDEWGGYGDWLALDGSGKVEGGTPKDLVGTATYAQLATLMAKIAGVLGNEGDKARYADLFQNIVAAFQKRFVTSEGLMASGTQTSYTLALQFDLLPEDLRTTAVAELVKSIKDKDYHLGTGFVGTPHVLPVLEKYGRVDVAYRLLEQETFPSWLFPVKNGATTIWERWDGWTPDKGMQTKWMNSFNHYAYGAVGAWMYGTVAGLSLDEKDPAYAHVVFKPRPGGGLSWAEASLETKHGVAAIRWELKDEALTCRLTVPERSKATLQPPAGFATEAQTLEPGEHTLTLNRREPTKRSAPARQLKEELEAVS